MRRTSVRIATMVIIGCCICSLKHSIYWSVEVKSFVEESEQIHHNSNEVSPEYTHEDPPNTSNDRNKSVLKEYTQNNLNGDSINNVNKRAMYYRNILQNNRKELVRDTGIHLSKDLTNHQSNKKTAYSSNEDDIFSKVSIGGKLNTKAINDRILLRLKSNENVWRGQRINVAKTTDTQGNVRDINSSIAQLDVMLNETEHSEERFISNRSFVDDNEQDMDDGGKEIITNTESAISSTEHSYLITESEDFHGEFLYGKQEAEFNINEVEKYQKMSEDLFRTFPNHQNATKYMIYYCSRKCGGLADRLKGITMVYMMSLLTGRRFGINMTTPCEIEHVFEPNLLDWRVPRTIQTAEMTLQILDYFERYSAYMIDYLKYDPDPVNMFDADIILMKSNQDWTRVFRKLSVSPTRFPQLYQYHSDKLLRTIYNGLFKPTPKLNTVVKAFFGEHVKGNKLACLHARIGEEDYRRYTNKQIMVPLAILKKFDAMDSYRIMVATDNQQVKTISQHMFKHFVDTSGPMLHIDHMLNSTLNEDKKCEGFMRSIVDHMILQRCDELILTASGFGVTAGSIRHTSRGLYVYMKDDTVVPTRRELLRETFQWRCIVRSWGAGIKDFYRNICDS